MTRKLLTLALALVMALCLLGSASAVETIAIENIKVGVVLIGPADDGFSGAHVRGMNETIAALGMNENQVLYRLEVPEDTATVEAAILDLISEGCNVIFSNSFGYMWAMDEMAASYPEVYFSHCSGYMSNEENFNNYFGAIYQARYLSGIAAGLKTKTNKIGYVGAVQNNAEVNGGLNAFALGAQSVNPDAVVYVKWLGSWGNPPVEKQLAQALIDMGCDVIGQHCDSSMPMIAAQENGVWGCGYNMDFTPEAPDAHLTAPIWNWSAVYIKEIKDIAAGEWNTNAIFMNMKDGLVDISPLTKNVAEGTADAIAAAREKIVSGEWDVFDGPLYDNQGNLVNEGKPLAFGDIVNGAMNNLLVKGVIEQ